MVFPSWDVAKDKCLAAKRYRVCTRPGCKAKIRNVKGASCPRCQRVLVVEIPKIRRV